MWVRQGVKETDDYGAVGEIATLESTKKILGEAETEAKDMDIVSNKHWDGDPKYENIHHYLKIIVQM